MTTKTTALARPLKELIPSIKAHIAEGKEAAREASAAHYLKAGLELCWAKPQVTGSWQSWLQKKLQIAVDTAGQWMRLARTEYPNSMPGNGFGAPPAGGHHKVPTNNQLERKYGKKSLADVNEEQGRPRVKPRHAKWVEAAREAVKKADQPRLRQEARDEKHEDKLRLELAKRIIDIGYRSLAAKMHPDVKGGTKQAMVRLNAVKRELLEALKSW